MDARQIVAKLGLEPHPEGGFFRETYRAATSLYTPPGERSLMTAILFLLVEGSPSGFHRLASDELWIHQAGDPLELALLDADRPAGERVLLGSPATGAESQYAIPAGVWQAAGVTRAGGWSLVCCVVSPGFDFDDFEMGRRDRLLAEFPLAAELIHDYTR